MAHFAGIPNRNYIELVKFIAIGDLGNAERERINKFVLKYRAITSHDPDYIIRSPGRVNLIGDHIDYHGFPVLPMAIKSSIILGCSFHRAKNNDKGDIEKKSSLNIFNVSSDIYANWTGYHSFKYGGDLDKCHEWQHYFLCGYHGVLASSILGIDREQIFNHAKEVLSSPSSLSEADLQISCLDSLTVLVDSDLPPASGLSSSSALVCASAIATIILKSRMNKISDSIDNVSIESCDLAENCSKFEHLIGTRGGGMDQAVIMTAQEGFAKYVEFVPSLRCENVKLPDGISVLISHSGLDHAKAATSKFNLRVLETKLGAAMIVKANDLDTSLITSSITLFDLKQILFPNMTSEKIVSHIRTHVFENKNEFCISEICEKLQISKQELSARFHISDKLLENLLGNKLKLLQRCEHVFEEADRVEKFKDCATSSRCHKSLGQLMTQSHYSLKDKFECSDPALDNLVQVALDAGAYGARLTGAGWGGCVVSIVHESKCASVIDKLKSLSKFTIRSEPESGCHVISVKM